jgi:hypothetical protein
MAFNLEEVDIDGAVREATDEVSGDTRLSFFRKGAVAGGAVLGGGAILSALVPGSAMAATTGAPPASFGKGDIGILNYALTLEYLESAFYTAALKNNVAKGNKMLTAFVTTVQKDELAHVELLKNALGSKAAKMPKFDFGKTVTDTDTFTATSWVLENTGVHAYLGQAPNIASSKILLTAASIVTIEARHAGAIGLFLGKSIAPSGPLDTGLPASKIIAAGLKTGFISG